MKLYDINYEGNTKSLLSLSIELVDAALWTAYEIKCSDDYHKKTWCDWPLSKYQFNLKHNHRGLNYRTYEEYEKSPDFIVEYYTDDDSLMGHLFQLLDNFNNYTDIYKWNEFLVVLSVGSSNTTGCSEGFSVIINRFTHETILIVLGEDDGNYWGEEIISYENLSIYDKGVVSSLVNEIDETEIYNKNELIKKLTF